MELFEAYKIIEKYLADTNKELGFSKINREDDGLTFKGNKGLYRFTFDKEANILSIENADEDNGDETEFNSISKSLFELGRADERACRSVANEAIDEIKPIFAARKKTNVDDIKMPKGISRGKAKSGLISYDVDSLANRFGVLYPEFKDDIKQNIVDYGDFLPETFFKEVGTPKVLDVIKTEPQQTEKSFSKCLTRFMKTEQTRFRTLSVFQSLAK